MALLKKDKKEKETYVQLDFFTDYDKKDKEDKKEKYSFMSLCLKTNEQSESDRCPLTMRSIKTCLLGRDFLR